VAWFENLPLVSYVFSDREGTAASVDLYYPMESDPDSLLAAIRLETRIQPLTACALACRRLTLGAALTGAPQPTGLNLDYGFLILHSDADTYTTLAIPGFRADLLMTTGWFAQQAVDMAHPDVIALVAAILDAGVCTQRGDLIVDSDSGGATQVWSDLERRSG